MTVHRSDNGSSTLLKTKSYNSVTTADPGSSKQSLKVFIFLSFSNVNSSTAVSLLEEKESNQRFGVKSCPTVCPNCKTYVLGTDTRYDSGLCTWLAFSGCVLLGCW